MNIKYYAADGTIKSLGDNELAHYKYIKKIKTGNGYRYFYSQEELRAYLDEKSKENLKDSQNAYKKYKQNPNKYPSYQSQSQELKYLKSTDEEKRRQREKTKETFRKGGEKIKEGGESIKEMKKNNLKDSRNAYKKYKENPNKHPSYQYQPQELKNAKATDKDQRKKRKKTKEALKEIGKFWFQSQTGVDPDDLKPEKKRKKKG